MSGRAFVWRWSLRTVRKEWRQYAVILSMLTVGVAAAVAGVLMVHNMTEPPESEYGNGQLEVNTGDPVVLERALEDSGLGFGVLQRATVERDGQVGQINLRAADPANPITEPLIDLLVGQWPSNDDEIAVTDGALSDRRLIGEQVQLEGRTVEIVGIVENPTRLSDEFVFARYPSSFDAARAPDATRFLVDASFDELEQSVPDNLLHGISSSDGPSERTAVTILVNVIVAFGMLEIALLVGSAFAVIARRRTRQYGLLASAGASPAMVQSAATSSGAIVGVSGTALGFVLGAVTARVLVPAMESSVDHRISFEYPVVALVPSLVLGIAVTTLAARRPAKALNRVSVASLLASMRPKAEPVGRAALIGVVIAVAGVLALAIGFKNEDEMLAIAGTLLAPIGVLLLAPLLVRGLGTVAARFPLSERLAGRSIARHNRRSASMVAALALALAIPMGIAVVTTSIDQRAENRPANLGDDQLVLWAPGVSPDRPVVPESIDEAALITAVETLTNVVPDLSFTPLQVVVRVPAEGYTEDNVRYNFPIATGEEVVGGTCNFCDVDTVGFDGSGTEYSVSLAFEATPELLDTLGIETDWLDEGSLAVAREPGLVAVDNGIVADEHEVAVAGSWPDVGSLPDLLYSPELADGFPRRTVGWLASAAAPLDDETLATIGRVDLTGIDLELPTAPNSGSSLRTFGLLIGLLIGLGITAAGVVLLTSENARDSALLASLGASPRTGRRTSAAIAGLLALAGALLAVIVGYLPLVPMRSSPLDEFPFVVPWLSLAALLFAFPAIAAGLGWLLSKKSADGLELRDFV